MTGKLPESGHHWLVCGCGIALPPSTLAPALKLSRNTLVDRNAQTHTDTHTVYQGSRSLSACIRREASFRVSKFPSTDRGDTDRNHTTRASAPKKSYETTTMFVLCNLMYIGFCCQEPNTCRFSFQHKWAHSKNVYAHKNSTAEVYASWARAKRCGMKEPIYTPPGWVTPGLSVCVCLSHRGPETQARELLVHLFGLLPPGWVAPQSL